MSWDWNGYYASKFDPLYRPIEQLWIGEGIVPRVSKPPAPLSPRYKIIHQAFYLNLRFRLLPKPS